MKRRIFAAASVLLLAVCTHAWGGTAGQVTHLSGVISAKGADGGSRLLAIKSDVQAGDTLTTEADTYARIKFADGAEVVLRPGTQLKIEAFSFDKSVPQTDNMLLSMLKGGLRAVTGLLGKRSREKVGLVTPTATIGIRGTHFGLLFCNNDCASVATTSGTPPENGLHVDVASGEISVSNSAGSANIAAGQFGFVKDASTLPALVPPQQGIQVTMPSSIAQNKAKGGGIGDNSDAQCVAH